MAKYTRVYDPKDEKDTQPPLSSPAYEFVAWQNVKDAEFPDWLRAESLPYGVQVAGPKAGVAGKPGESLTLTLPDRVETVAPNGWVVKRSDNVYSYADKPAFEKKYRLVG